MNKKGDATDYMIILLIIFFLAVSFIIGIFVNTKISDVISTTALNESVAYESINTSFTNINANGVQRAFVAMFAILIIFSLLSAFLVRVHPAFLFIYIIMLAITMFTAVFVGNVYGQMQDNATLNAVMETQPMINYIMTNIVKIIMGIGGLSMIIVFAKLFGAPSSVEGGRF